MKIVRNIVGVSHYNFPQTVRHLEYCKFGHQCSHLSALPFRRRFLSAVELALQGNKVSNEQIEFRCFWCMEILLEVRRQASETHEQSQWWRKSYWCFALSALRCVMTSGS